MPARNPLTPAEFNVLKALWRLGHSAGRTERTGAGTVADVRTELAAHGVALAYTTVMTLLGRLAAKQAVLVDRSREPFVYRAAHGRESVLAARIKDFVRDVFDGDARALVLHLAGSDALSQKERGRIEAAIAEAEAEPPSAPKPQRRGRPR